MIRVYHGSNLSITQPEVAIGRDNLDFGKAFYVTRIKEQAERWAEAVWSRHEKGTPTLNTYNLDMESITSKNYKILEFKSYDRKWLNFIIGSRKGEKPWFGYDLIEGGVADDRVIDTIEAYMAGDISEEKALGRLRYYEPNNQIAILNQQIIDEHLQFISSDIVATD